MSDRPQEPPLSDELPELYQKAAEIDDPEIYRILDIIVAHRRRQAKRARAANGGGGNAA